MGASGHWELRAFNQFVDGTVKGNSPKGDITTRNWSWPYKLLSQVECRGVNGISYLTIGTRIQRRITQVAQILFRYSSKQSVCVWNRMLRVSNPATNDESIKTVGGLGTKGLSNTPLSLKEWGAVKPARWIGFVPNVLVLFSERFDRVRTLYRTTKSRRNLVRYDWFP